MTAPLYAEIDLNRLPRHVAIIMDGNGRWAKQHKVKVALGHRTGTETLREIIRSSSDIGIEALSLYAFSTENWARPAAEVEALMQLILDFFASEIDELDEKNVRITILGDKDALPPRQRDVLRRGRAPYAGKHGTEAQHRHQLRCAGRAGAGRPADRAGGAVGNAGPFPSR